MSDIVVRRTHGMTMKKARIAAEDIAAKLDEEFDLEYAWDGNTLEFRRTGVNGYLAVSKKEVEISVRLGFLMLAFRGRIEEEIHAYFDEHFGKSAGPMI
jgi:putative polyhydroxyalkanoate system protein